MSNLSAYLADKTMYDRLKGHLHQRIGHYTKSYSRFTANDIIDDKAINIWLSTASHSGLTRDHAVDPLHTMVRNLLRTKKLVLRMAVDPKTGRTWKSNKAVWYITPPATPAELIKTYAMPDDYVLIPAYAKDRVATAQHVLAKQALVKDALAPDAQNELTPEETSIAPPETTGTSDWRAIAQAAVHTNTLLMQAITSLTEAIGDLR